jgi:CheY-like chemotaxis protein
MPVLDGLAMKDAMRRKFPKLPFLIITGKILSRDDQLNSDALCAYLEKPFETPALNLAIRKLMTSRAITQSNV